MWNWPTRSRCLYFNVDKNNESFFFIFSYLEINVNQVSFKKMELQLMLYLPAYIIFVGADSWHHWHVTWCTRATRWIVKCQKNSWTPWNSIVAYLDLQNQTFIIFLNFLQQSFAAIIFLTICFKACDWP